MGFNPRSATEGLCVLGEPRNLSEPAMEGLMVEPNSEGCWGVECEHEFGHMESAQYIIRCYSH